MFYLEYVDFDFGFLEKFGTDGLQSQLPSRVTGFSGIT